MEIATLQPCWPDREMVMMVINDDNDLDDDVSLTAIRRLKPRGILAAPFFSPGLGLADPNFS